MLSGKELKQMFQEAVEDGYITNLDNYAECTGRKPTTDCHDCPAYSACEQLAGGTEGTYKQFKENFDKLYKHKEE